MVDTELSEDKLITMPVSTLVQIIMSLNESCQELNRRLTIAEEQIAIMNQRVYGRKSEAAVSPLQLQLDLGLNEAEVLAEEKEEETQLEEAAPRKKKAAGKKKEDWKKITNHREEYITLSEEELNEKYGEGKWKRLPDEIVCQLEHHPASFEAVTYHIAVYAKNDNQTIVRAPKPLQLFSKSIATPSLVAGIMNAKYVNAIPLYRQEQELKRNGINISRQVMANWTIQCADRYLAVMYDWLHSKIYSYHVLQADETPVIVTKDGRHAGAKSYMWVYRTGKMYQDRPIILYEYQKERKADHPREFLKAFQGVVVTDGYEVYHKLARERQDLKIAGCWSHARRRFSEAVKAAGPEAGKRTVAYLALQRIAEIYSVDNRLADLSPEERLKKRQTLVRPLVEDYFAWLEELNPRIPARTKTGNGFAYCLKQKPYLMYFLEDGEVPIDNNAAEQVIRPFCVGKKNWLMIDTIAGAKSSAIIYSIAETAKANHLNPFRYFELLLTQIPRHMEDTDRKFLEQLEPWSPDLPEECRKQLE